MISVIYQDDNVIVINKPPGISVHGGGSVRGKTVADFLLEDFPELIGVGEDPLRPGIVHRLDKDTSGVMVVARTQEAFGELKRMFMAREMEKTYWAIVCGTFKESSGVVSLPIGRMIRNPVKRWVDDGNGRVKGSREAQTEFRVLKESSEYSLVELKPKTGRMHQLRVHMASLGRPIACDALYGGKTVCCPSRLRQSEADPKGAGRQLLHAYRLQFSFEGGRREFIADPPEDFTVAQKALL